MGRALLSLGLLLTLASPAAAGIPVPEGAYAEGAAYQGENRVRARLLVHPDDRVADGRVRLGVHFELAPGWHIYSQDPGDSGIATELRWQLPDAEIGPTAWPPHEIFEEADGLLTTYGYANDVLLASTLQLGESVRESDPVRVHVTALACLVECIPVEFTLFRKLAFEGAEGSADLTRRTFDRDAATLAADGSSSSGDTGLTLLAALGLALLGGLVLNAMPCVLPVLAIKLVTLAELAQRDRREVVASAVAYALGVSATMLALAAVVAALRAAGTSVGWGFQFQEPVFIAAVSMVLVVFALNLFGVFEFRFNPGRIAEFGNDASGVRRSFFEGLLVVVLATPCSAPFLGTAVGFAFASATPVIFAVFGAVGLGLASPYLLVALSPGWAQRVPRAGAWMLQLRAGLGFLLLATTVWLLWVFGRSVGSDGLAGLLALLLGVAFAVWAHGAFQGRGRVRLASASALATLAAIAVSLVGIHRAFDADAEPRTNDSDSAWHAYDPAGVAESLAAGHSVFVSFTADWCITCKVNERGVLADEEVLDTFEREGVVRFRADWTRRDEAIRTELARFGRAGVPLYLVYHPEAPDQPAQLPELLRVNDVIDALQRTQRPESVTPDTRSNRQASM